MLQIDNVEYKNQFLQFGQNNGINTHFTIRKYGVTKEMNLFFLEKFWCLLFNAQLEKSFLARHWNMLAIS